MKSHPGGEAHTLRLLELTGLPHGASVLDMGAGAGESLALLRKLGYMAEGIDLAPRSKLVEQRDFLRTGYPDGSFDAVLSQCAFFVSGDQPAALQEAHRILRTNGLLMISDVFFKEPQALLEDAGFQTICAEDMTPQWREYYLEALWRDECSCTVPKGKCSYMLLIGRKE